VSVNFPGINSAALLCLETAHTRASRRRWVSAFHQYGCDPTDQIAAIAGIIDDQLRRRALTALIGSQLRSTAHHYGFNSKIALYHQPDSANEVKLSGHMPEKVRAILSQSFREVSEESSEAMRRSVDYSFDKDAVPNAEKDFHEGLPLTLATGWAGHATEITFRKPILAYTTRSKPRPGVTFYIIGNIEAINAEFFLKATSRSRAEGGKKEMRDYLEKGGMVAELNLTEVGHVGLAKQSGGTCAWSNAMGGLLALELLRTIKSNTISMEHAIPYVRSVLAGWEISHMNKPLTALCQIWEEFPEQAAGILRRDGALQLIETIRKKLLGNPTGTYNVFRPEEQTSKVLQTLEKLDSLIGGIRSNSDCVPDGV
jgi:hypothetical protein